MYFFLCCPCLPKQRGTVDNTPETSYGEAAVFGADNLLGVLALETEDVLVPCHCYCAGEGGADGEGEEGEAGVTR